MNEINFALSKEFQEFVLKHERPWEYTWVPCPRCGSNKVVFREKSEVMVRILKSIIWYIAIIATGILPGLLYCVFYFQNNPAMSRDFLCKDCRLQWKKEDMMPS